MAIEEFWRNVRRTENWIGLRIESSPEPEQDIEANLRGARYWLKPGGVWGYDPADFNFLSEAERSRLEEGVKGFRRAAESIPGRAMATVEQYKEGEAGFRKILEIVRPEKYRDVDAFVIGKKIEGLIGREIPEWVRGMTFEAKNDSIGDPALYITVLADDDAMADNVLRENSRFVDDLLTGAARAACPDRWPYVWFRVVSGQNDEMQVHQA
jgi:hypothetical protein